MAMDGIFAPRLCPTEETRAVGGGSQGAESVAASDMRDLEMKHVAGHEQTHVLRAMMKIDWRS